MARDNEPNLMAHQPRLRVGYDSGAGDHECMVLARFNGDGSMTVIDEIFTEDLMSHQPEEAARELMEIFDADIHKSRIGPTLEKIAAAIRTRDAQRDQTITALKDEITERAATQAQRDDLTRATLLDEVALNHFPRTGESWNAIACTCGWECKIAKDPRPSPLGIAEWRDHIRSLHPSAAAAKEEFREQVITDYFAESAKQFEVSAQEMLEEIAANQIALKEKEAEGRLNIRMMEANHIWRLIEKDLTVIGEMKLRSYMESLVHEGLEAKK